ncbi:MAG TPA: ABC transporter permease [Candidatus Dormibacteraeota bacterium]
MSNALFLQWMLLRRVLSGHTPFRLTGLMTIGNLVLGVGAFYFMTVVVGTGSARTKSVYDLYGGPAGFMAVGVATNQLLTVGMASIQRAIADERSQGTLAYWATTGRHMVPLVLRASLGEFVLACCNAVLTFVLLVVLFQVHFNIDVGSFLVVMAVSLVAVAGVGLAAAGLFVAGYHGQNPVTWAWGLTTTFIAGVYVPIQVFDNWLLQLISQFVPSTHALLAMRSAVLRHASLGDSSFLNQLLPWLVFAVVMAPVGLWAFHAGLRRAYLRGQFVQS